MSSNMLNQWKYFYFGNALLLLLIDVVLLLGRPALWLLGPVFFFGISLSFYGTRMIFRQAQSTGFSISDLRRLNKENDLRLARYCLYFSLSVTIGVVAWNFFDKRTFLNL